MINGILQLNLHRAVYSFILVFFDSGDANKMLYSMSLMLIENNRIIDINLFELHISDSPISKNERF